MCVGTCLHTNSNLPRRAHIHRKPFGNHYKHCRCAQAGIGPDECSYRGLRLVHHIDSRCSYLSKSVGRGCGDGGVERQTVRSLREYSGWWILCFLAVTPTGFINSLVKTGKARCGLSAFWSKCTGGVLCNGHLDSDCRTQLIPIFRCPGPVEGSLAARLLIFFFLFFFLVHLTFTDTSCQLLIYPRSDKSRFESSSSSLAIHALRAIFEEWNAVWIFKQHTSLILCAFAGSSFEIHTVKLSDTPDMQAFVSPSQGALNWFYFPCIYSQAR